jgi:hypothetical protein
MEGTSAGKEGVLDQITKYKARHQKVLTPKGFRKKPEGQPGTSLG